MKLRKHFQRLCAGAVAATLLTLSSGAQAQDKIRFSLDWRFEGQTSFVWIAQQKGYFKDEGLDVQIDAGNGSGAAIQRIASGAYDIALGDMSSLIEALGNNPGAAGMQVVYQVYDEAPIAYLTMKKSGIRSVRDLQGKNVAAATFDISRKLWPIFAKAAGVKTEDVTFSQVQSNVRANMVMRGDMDAAGGFYNMTMEFEERGVPRDQLNIVKVSDLGLHLYGNGVIASSKLIRENPKAVAGFVRAFNRAFREGLADPVASVKALKEREGLVDERIELERFALLVPAMLTPRVKERGLGNVDPAVLARQVDAVNDALTLKAKPEVAMLFNASFLPPLAERMPLAPRKP
jgi:NitT/TauT family transport system substrate-binding protein